MKKHTPIFFFALFVSFLSLFSCTKINESTTLGGGLIPGVDNINTFDTTLEVFSDNRIVWDSDTTRLGYDDFVAVGQMNDPEFGGTKANLYFNIYKDTTLYSVYPFIAPKDSLKLDSVVLSLTYAGSYGDSMATQNFSVFEISPASSFRQDSFYRFANVPDFAVGTQLATKSFRNIDLDDSISYRLPNDTSNTRTANVLRIKLSNSFGSKLLGLDTAIYRNFEQFRTIVPGLAIRPTGGNALSYFTLLNRVKTNVQVYYKAQINGRDSAQIAYFSHHVNIPASLSINPPNFVNGKADIISRTPAGSYATYGGTGNNDPVIHLQAAPGSIAYITIPGLSNLSNRLVHRAELIVPRVASPGDAIFEPPFHLFLDHVKPGGTDAYNFHLDNPLSRDGQYDVNTFGGNLKSDNAYHFILTRYVQGIVTKGDTNDTLRLSAPLKSNVIDLNLQNLYGTAQQRATIDAIGAVANGRVVVGGGSNPVPAQRMRLRIIYSKI